MPNEFNIKNGFISADNSLVNGALVATTISATTYQNLPIDVRVTGGTFSSGTITFINNTGGTFNVTGVTTSTATNFTGGTVTGATNFTGGLTANTISATTYQNLPQDIFVTGGTYTNGTATFTNNSGGTFNVTGFNIGGITKEKFQDNYFSGDLIVLPNTPIFIYYLTNNGQILTEGEDDDYVVDGNEITLNYTLTNKKIIVLYEY
jgi:hypothetical protein